MLQACSNQILVSGRRTCLIFQQQRVPEFLSKLLKAVCINYGRKFSHIPVMAREVTEALYPNKEGVYLDMTFGGGGHSRYILDNLHPVTLYCLDRDPIAYQAAIAFSKKCQSNIKPLLGRFSELDRLLKENSIPMNSLDGVLIDAGCSSMQMDDPCRGFSIQRNGPLDMRMDGSRFADQPTAADVLNSLDVPSLAKIFKVYGEEKYSKRIAQALFDARYLLKRINTTNELADLVLTTLQGEYRTDKLQRTTHTATKVFQALRIFVNNELNELNYAVNIAHSYLKPGGRLIVLTFHSLEDRIIKRHMFGIDMDEPLSQTISQKYKNATTWHTLGDVTNTSSKKWTVVNKNVILPTEDEIFINPRSRSAKMRVAIKK